MARGISVVGGTPLEIHVPISSLEMLTLKVQGISTLIVHECDRCRESTYYNKGYLV